MWLCRVCAAPWPCGQARIDLLQDYEGNSIGLGIYLATQMIDAIRDLCALTPYDPPHHQTMWVRFMSCVVNLRRGAP